MILKYYCSLARKVILLFTFCLNEKQNKNWNVVRVNITVVVFLCSVCNEVLSYLIHFNVISMFFFYIFTSCYCYDYCCCSCCFHVKNKATYSHFLKILNEDNFDFRFSFHVQLYFFLFSLQLILKTPCIEEPTSFNFNQVVCFVFYV